MYYKLFFFFFQAEDGIRDYKVTEFRRVLFRSDDERAAHHDEPERDGVSREGDRRSRDVDRRQRDAGAVDDGRRDDPERNDGGVLADVDDRPPGARSAHLCRTRRGAGPEPEERRRRVPDRGAAEA